MKLVLTIITSITGTYYISWIVWISSFCFCAGLYKQVEDSVKDFRKRTLDEYAFFAQSFQFRNYVATFSLHELLIQTFNFTIYIGVIPSTLQSFLVFTFLVWFTYPVPFFIPPVLICLFMLSDALVTSYYNEWLCDEDFNQRRSVSLVLLTKVLQFEQKQKSVDKARQELEQERKRNRPLSTTPKQRNTPKKPY